MAVFQQPIWEACYQFLELTATSSWNLQLFGLRTGAPGPEKGDTSPEDTSIAPLNLRLWLSLIILDSFCQENSKNRKDSKFKGVVDNGEEVGFLLHNGGKEECIQHPCEPLGYLQIIETLVWQVEFNCGQTMEGQTPKVTASGKLPRPEVLAQGEGSIE